MFSAIRDLLLSVYFRLPEHPGKYRISRWLGRHLIPRDGIKTKLRNGIRLHLHPQDWIEYLLLSGREYEPMTLEFLRANLSSGDTAVLAGVNFGLHAIVAAQSVGPKGLVVGFEPQPAAVMRARTNFLLNGVSERVHMVLAALGSDERLISMAWSKFENAGAASLLDTGTGFSVYLAPLAKLLPSVCSASPKVVLLDVQGYELLALAGLPVEARPDVIVVESDPEFLSRAGTTAQALLNFIRGLGYSTHTLTGNVIADESIELPERNIIGVWPGANPKWVRRHD